MAEVKIIYWSGTGNTAAMAQSVADGVAAAGAEAKIIPVENAGAADIADVKAFALGLPVHGGRAAGRIQYGAVCRRNPWQRIRQKDPVIRILWLGRWRMDAQLGGTDDRCRR